MNWHVITTRPNREGAVSNRLQYRWPHGAGAAPEVYLPTYASDTGRRLPLFPGYVLACFEADQRCWIIGDGARTYRDVLGILDGVVTAGELAAVRFAESVGALPSEDHLEPGNACEARVGASVIEGKFQRSAHGRAWILAELLGRPVSIPVDLRAVRKTA